MYINLILIPILLIGICEGQLSVEEYIIEEIFDRNAGLPTTTQPSLIPERRTPPTVQPKSLTNEPKSSNCNTGPSSFRVCGTGKQCVCFYLCSNGSAIDDGSGLFNPRVDTNDCPMFETCCAMENQVQGNIPTLPDLNTSCGYRNDKGIGYQIKTENEAQFAEFPWMVAVLRVEEIPGGTFDRYTCGGSLISPLVVITAAHCVDLHQPKEFKLRAGEWESNNKNEMLPHQDRQVVEIIVHENFNSRNFRNDIALLFVDVAFDLTHNVNTICMPPAKSNFDYSRCYATGWGKDKFQNGKYYNILKKMDLPVIPNALCQTNLRNTRLSRIFILHPSFMCAGGELGKDMCTGDGGSPLVCPMINDPKRYFQVGIVSWGIECGNEFVPGVYANVPYLRTWIDRQLGYKNVDPQYFTA